MSPQRVWRLLVVVALVFGLGVVGAPAAGAVPLVPEKVSPKGSSDTPRPTYIWNSVAGAVRYHLLVRNVHGTPINQGYTAAAAGCAGGGRCSATPTNLLAKGVTYWWTVTAGDATGWSPYGPWFEFKPGGVPPWVRPIDPSGTINVPIVNYVWEAWPDATGYDLVVQFEPNTSRDRVILSRRFTAAQVGCAGAGVGGRCSFLGPTAGPGAHVWWVRACNALGCGPWRGLGFNRT